MSEVLRFWCHEARNIRCVRKEDFDAAQVELAALREELAKSREAAKEELEGVKYTRRKFRQERDDLQQRLTATEQRFAALAKAATEFKEYAESGWDHFPDVGVNLRAALAQPTESGASE